MDQARAHLEQLVAKPAEELAQANEQLQEVEYLLTKQVIVEQKPVQVHVSQPDVDPAELALMQEAGIKSLLVLPMISKQETLGLVELSDSRKKRVFSESQISLAQLLTNQAASAAQNARLYQQDQQEITERGRAEAALQVSQERFAMAMQAAKVGVWDWNLLTGAFFVDPNLKALLGYTDEEIPNDIEVWTNYVHPEDRQPLMEAAQAHLEGRTPEYVFVHRMLHKDGSFRWFLARGVAIRDAQGQAIRMVGSDTDITEHKQAEEALRTSQQLFQCTLDSLSTNIAVLDETGLIIAVNASWRDFADENGLGWADYGVGKNYLAVVDAASGPSAEGAQEVARGIREVISGQRDQFSLEYACHSPCDECWFTMHATRFQSSQGVGIAVSHENITARKRAEKQLEEAAAAAERQRLARELHDSVTQSLFLAASMAETLPRVWERNPDQAFRAMAELRRLTHGALAEMRTMLLELRPSALTKQRLGLLLRQLTDGMMARTQMEVVMTSEGDCSLPDEVQIPLYRITQEALNNIVKHSRADRAIVRLRCEPEQVVISIRDDGVGFDPHALEPSSLGLGIMREWAQTINAEFVLESEPGRGTEVTVTWEDNSGTNEP